MGPSARTLQRHFARLELSTRPDGSPPKAFGRFEAAACDELGPTGCTARSSTAAGRCCSRCWTTTPAMWSGTAGGMARTPWACRPRCTTRSRPTAARSGCTATTAAAYSSHQLAWSAAVLDIKLVHSAPGRPQGRGKIERWNRTVRDQFLVEVDPTRCTSLEELNRCSPWLHQHYHRGVHSETGPPRPSATTPRPRPAAHTGPGVAAPGVSVARAAQGHRVRHGLPARQPLRGRRGSGRTVDLLFTPFDLTVIEVEYQTRPMGTARPHHIGRHVHPAVKPDDTAPIEATGIDYLRLLEHAHHAEVGHAINYPALADEGTRRTRAGRPAGAGQPG